jgi:hypothetical protein
MAITNLQLNVRANTARAMSDFKRFSSSLDNQFLVSGLKLDVVRNALGQINREFQKSIGEQGLIGASSLRAAQNQAAMLSNIFKGFSDEASINITTQLGTALNNVAVKAGGTMKDVQRTLAATPFIDANLSDKLREQLTTGIMRFQRDFRRAGLGDNFAGMAQQFLSAKVTGRELINTGDPMSSFLGAEIIKRSNGQGFIDNPARRTQILQEILEDPETIKQLEMMAKRAMGFRIVLEDLNTQLFNTESGVFGSLRKVIDRTGKQTTMFDEVQNLVDQVFGPSGMFRSLFSSIKEIFKIGDPLRPLIDAIQFMTGVFKGITEYFKSEQFKTILFLIKDTFYRVSEFFTNVYKTVKEAIPKDAFERVTNVFKDLRQQITSGSFDPSNIVKFISDIGEGVREYIRKVGKAIRERDDEDEMGFMAEIGTTLLSEVGKTARVLIKELFATLVDKIPEIASAVLPSLNRGINGLLEEMFGQFAGIAKMAMATLPGPVGMVARASMLTDMTGGKGNLGAMAAMAPFLLAGGGGLAGMGGRLLTGMGRGPMAMRATGLGMMGMDPAVSLLGAFAPQIIGGGARSVMGAGSQIGAVARPIGNFLTPAISRAATGGVSGARSLGSAISLGVQSGLARASGYLGAVGPLTQSGLARASAPLNRASVFLRSQQSQFMAGFKPLFPNVAIGGPTTRAFQAGQFFRNIPSMGSSAVSSLTNAASSLGSNILGIGRSAATSAKTTASALSSTASALGSGVVSLGKAVAARGVSALLEIQRVSRMFMLGASGSAVFTRGRPAVQAGMAFRKFGAPVALAGGLTVLGANMLGGAIGGDTGKAVSGVGSVLGSGMSGAAIGATIGSIVPGVGTAVGAVIGGIIGGVAPLFDKGVREGIEIFVDGIKEGFSKTLTWFVKGTQENFDRAKNLMGSITTNLVNGLIFIFNGILSGFQILPRLIMSMVESVYEKIPGKEFIPGLKGLVEGGKTVANFQIPTIGNNYSGKNFAGPALALEARMSGRNAMVVNDGEFVIPSNGFATLAGLVGENLRNREVVRRADGPTQINVSLTVNTSSFIANAEQIAQELRRPVLDILDQAWNEYSDSTTVLRSKTT